VLPSFFHAVDCLRSVVVWQYIHLHVATKSLAVEYDFSNIDRENHEAETTVDENELVHRHIKKFQV
jgi:hypothetical protein